MQQTPRITSPHPGVIPTPTPATPTTPAPAYDPREAAIKPVPVYRPEVITSSKKIADIVTSLNSNAILLPPNKPKFKKVIQPLNSILGDITRTHSTSKPKGSRNIPVTTKRTIFVRANPTQMHSHAATQLTVSGNGPSTGKGQASCTDNQGDIKSSQAEEAHSKTTTQTTNTTDGLFDDNSDSDSDSTTSSSTSSSSASSFSSSDSDSFHSLPDVPKMSQGNKRPQQDGMELSTAKSMRATVSQRYDDKVNAARSAKNPEFKPTDFVSTNKDLNWVSKARTGPKPHALQAYEQCPLLTLRYEKSIILTFIQLITPNELQSTYKAHISKVHTVVAINNLLFQKTT